MACVDIEYSNSQSDHDLTLIFRDANSQDWWAGSFTVGGAARTICQVSAYFHTRAGAGAPDPNTLHCEIWSDSAGTPNAQVGVDSATDAFTDIATDATLTEIIFTWAEGTGPELSANTKYWAVIQKDWVGSNTWYCKARYGNDGGGSNKYATYDIGTTTWTFVSDAGDNALLDVYYEAAGGAPEDDGSALRRRIQYHRRNR